jgi:hypothetical protein
MTINPTDTPTEDGSMFAPVPAWERGKKRRSFGRRAPAEPRSFAPAAATMDETAPIMGSPMEPEVDRLSDVDPANSTFAAAPIYVSNARSKSNGPVSAPVAIAAGLILIGGIAAAGWYYTQPHGQAGVAELTPGGATTTTTTDTTAAAPAPPSQMAQNTPPPVAKTTTTTGRDGSVTTRTRTAPARSRAASDTAADASTTAPAQASSAPMPLPTPGVAPPAAAATPAAPLVLNIPPAATAPAATPQAVTPQTAPEAAAPPPTQVPQA